MTHDEVVKCLKRSIIRAAHQAGEGHVASALSIVDALYVLYKYIRHNPEIPYWPARDFVILSKGHGCLALYAVLAFNGYFPPEKLSTFCKFRSILGGHPDRHKIPGVEACTGSLGHGLPIAVGIAKALKIQRRTNRVYCIVGDGELNEGSNWEALLIAEQHKLDNLTILVDHNHSNDRAIAYHDTNRFFAKLKAFGCNVNGVFGHSLAGINYCLDSANAVTGCPKCIVLDTVKGHGIKEMENNPAWHHRAPTAEELGAFLKELE
jgi:transketolase